MDRRNALRLETALIVAVGLLLWAPRFVLQFAPPAPYDEGNTVVAAWRVLAGERLYRDVWQMHAPGSAWSLALAFRLLGATLFTERLVKAVLVALTLALLFRIARRMAGPSAAAAAVVFGTLLPPQNPFLRPNDPASAAVLLAATLVLMRAHLRAPWPTIGLAVGLAAAFRLDFGAGAAAAIGAFLALRGEGRRIPLVLRAAAILPALAAAALLAQGVAQDAWQQMFVFPATSYRAHRGMPVYDLVSVVPPFALCLAAALSAHRLRRRDPVRSEALLMTACLALGYLGYAWARPDLEHTLPLRALGLVAAAGLVSASADLGKGARLAAWAAIAVAAGAIAAPAGFAVRETLRLASALVAEGTAGSGARLPAGGPLLRLDADAVAIAARLAERTRPGDRVFVGNTRHDRVLVNDVLLYFLADRPSVTRYYNLHPGLATRADVQAEIAAAIDRENAQAVALWRAPLWEEPNASATPGATLLDEALRARFVPRETRGRYELWERVSATTASGAR